LQAVEEAWAAAGCGAPERAAALVVAVGLEQAFLEDFAPYLRDGHVDLSRPEPAGFHGPRFRAPIDDALGALAARLSLTGPPIAHVSACAAGARAIAQAAALIERGEADVVVTGGMDSMVNPLGLGGMARLGAPSPRAEPDACRPFDRRRDGLVIGEGAAMFVLEHEARARARGAPVWARVLGWGSTQDGYRVTVPRPDGRAAAGAMTRAIARAGIAPAAIGYVNAHGTGTPLNDPAEAAAIHLALGAHGARVPVSSIKGAVGHLMAAAGAIEVAACLLPFARGLLPGTAHHREPDPACLLNVIGERPAPAGDVAFVLSNSFGFGGQNASVVLGRPV
jgi:3-oxoacyl-[acyl-carrier-protein] synthase II